MNNKITVLLTALLVVTLAVPVFADGHMEDNVKITGDVKTVFQVGGYGDEEAAAIKLWEDDDALDEAAKDDPDLFPADKAFYQEINFNVAAMVNENINFNLAIDTLANNFTDVEGYNDDFIGTLGDPGAEDDLTMDNALLTISDDVSTIKLGDMGGYHGDVYFLDDEDVEGMEMTTAMNGNDIKVFMVGNDDDGEVLNEMDAYGVTVSRALESANVTGKIYQARRNGKDITDIAVAADGTLTDTVSMNGEVVFSDDSEGDSDSLMMLGADFKVSDAVTVNAGMEMAGEDFNSFAGDLEENNNYDLFTVGGDMVLDENNTVGAAYTMVDHDEPEDKSTIELTLDNVTGEYKNNASIAFTTNDNYTDDSDVTVIKLGTEYAMDMATVSANLTNQSADDNYDNEFTYLTVGYDQQISDNVTWNTSLGYITGTASGELVQTTDDNGDPVDTINVDDVDGDSTTLKTALTVSF